MRRTSQKIERNLPSMARKGKRGQVLILRSAFPRKSDLQSIATYARSMVAPTQTHNTGECHRYEKDESAKTSFCTAKKGGKRSYPANQNFAQLTKKIEKLEKVLKKSGKKSKKRRYKDCNSDSE